MHPRKNTAGFTILGLVLGLALLASYSFGQGAQLTNILWITSENNSPFLACYGDQNATTSNLDQLEFWENYYALDE